MVSANSLKSNYYGNMVTRVGTCYGLLLWLAAYLFDGVGEFFECLGGDGGQHRVHHGHVLRGSDGAELESVTAVGEGRGAVAVLGGDLDGCKHRGAHGEELGRGHVGLALAVDVSLVKVNRSGLIIESGLRRGYILLATKRKGGSHL